MPIQPPLANDKKRVKVYELRNSDWFDLGTGLCTGQLLNDEHKILVESEDQPERMLLETKIAKNDGYQKQQDTLIVWTAAATGTDMALSFQEAEGCAVIWKFVLPDEGLSDDALDSIATSFTLSPPTLGNLDEIEHSIRAASITQAGRDSMAKFLIREDYLLKLIPLVGVAEELESLADLHRLCNIMKALILMNDNSIIEHLVDDNIILGVVGALEYDPDFPAHKANHRQYLADESRFKEVVEIKHHTIRKKIRQTWRLQYLKDVVLARILDDPTFGVLNSLIFFNQVDIVQHLQNNSAFLKELFAIFTSAAEQSGGRKEQAVLFLQQCAAIAKTLQLQSRASLLNNLIQHGLFNVIAFAVKHPSPSMRTTGIDILVALLDHDPNMMRGYMLKAVHEKRVPLTDTLIDLLHAETDLGAANEQFAQDTFDRSCRRLFAPLKSLELRASVQDFSYQDVSLFVYMVDILTFFIRQHPARSRHFVASENLSARVAQLLRVPQKPLKLTALKFFRTAIALQDPFYAEEIINSQSFEPIIAIVLGTMPRDNLLNSACLEMFEFIRKEAIKPMILHLGEHYRHSLEHITYVDTFTSLLLRFDQLTTHKPEVEHMLLSQDDETPPPVNRAGTGARWQGLTPLTPESEKESSPDGKTPPRQLPIAHKTLQPSPEIRSANEHDFLLQHAPERLAEKRRRQESEEDDDELSKLTSGPKRRNSTNAAPAGLAPQSGLLKRKKAGFLKAKQTASPDGPDAEGKPSRQPSGKSLKLEPMLGDDGDPPVPSPSPRR
ncbi:hypothetical protein DV737_g2620, partial [Chaetothyriales sp. CBS 132003]